MTEHYFNYHILILKSVLQYYLVASSYWHYSGKRLKIWIGERGEVGVSGIPEE
jgi:hypothetical protein